MKQKADFLINTKKLQLTRDDIFDRIINLKFYVTEYGENKSGVVSQDEYVIRSDYEVVYPKLNIAKVMQTGNIASKSYYVRKCRYKPDIKIQYSRVSKSTDVSVDIFVSNFQMLDSQGRNLVSFSNDKLRISRVQVMMGYFGQFKDLPHETFQDLHNFDNIAGIDTLNFEVQYATTDKLPPDSVLHIHAFVGNIVFGAPVGEIETKSYDEVQTSTLIENVTESSGEKTAIEKLLFQHITRRFLRRSTLLKSEFLFDVNGFMSETDANKYGVKVFCSQGVKDISVSNIQSKIKDSSGNEVDNTIYFNSGITAENTLINISGCLGITLVYTVNNDGNIVVYTEEESRDPNKIKESFEKAGNDYAKDTTLDKMYDHILPAVYNINIDATTTIVAPYFYFISPFDYVLFESRYALSNLASYYASFDKSFNKFTVTKQSVSFATVEDVNEMTLLCTTDFE